MPVTQKDRRLENLSSSNSPGSRTRNLGCSVRQSRFIGGARRSRSTVSVMYNPNENVKCHANEDGTGGIDGFTITNDVDLLFE
jgi:hypothetical protein